MTPEEIQEMHYIPANNAFAFYVVGGWEGVERQGEEEVARMLEVAGTDATQVNFIGWYQKSIRWIVAKRLIDQSYPPYDPLVTYTIGMN